MKLTFIVVLTVLKVAFSEIVTINKCCRSGHLLDENLVCRSHPKEWIPTIVTKNFTKTLSETEVKSLLKSWNVQFTRPKCEGTEMEELVRFEKKPFLLLDNGSFWYEGDLLTSRAFCIDGNSAVVCVKGENNEPVYYDGPPAEQIKRVYIKKCCRSKKIYSKELAGCTVLPYPEPVTVSKFLEHTASSSVLNISNTFFEYGFPDCGEGYIFTGKLSEHNSSLQQDGSLYLPTAKVLLEPKTFCLEYVEEDKSNLPTILTCPNYLPVPVNGSRIAPEQGDIRLTLYPLALFISVFFLAATLATGYLVPTTHHMLHWRCQTCHVACLMLGDFLLAITQIVGHTFPQEICTIFGEYNFRHSKSLPFHNFFVLPISP